MLARSTQRLRTGIELMTHASTPFSLNPLPSSTSCKCCNGVCRLVTVMDAVRSGADVRTGRAVDALTGRVVSCHRCQGSGFTFTRAFDHWTTADFAKFIYNDDCIRHDPSCRDWERESRTAADVIGQFGSHAARLSVAGVEKAAFVRHCVVMELRECRATTRLLALLLSPMGGHMTW